MKIHIRITDGIEYMMFRSETEMSVTQVDSVVKEKEHGSFSDICEAFAKSQMFRDVECQSGDESYCWLINARDGVSKVYRTGWMDMYPWNDNTLFIKRQWGAGAIKCQDKAGAVDSAEYGDWRRVSDINVTATKEELKAFWKVASIKNAMNLGVKPRISSADPRVDNDTVVRISGILSGDDWYNFLVKAGFKVNSKWWYKELSMENEWNVRIQLYGVTDAGNGRYTFASAAIEYTGTVDREGGKDWDSVIQGTADRYGWLEGAPFEEAMTLSRLNGGEDEEGRLYFHVTDGNVRLTFMERHGKCVMKPVADVLDDGGETLFQYEIRKQSVLI